MSPPWGTYLHQIYANSLILYVFMFVYHFRWWLSNKYLRVQGIHSVEQKVEWLYCFDVHCNSFFPLFLLLYVFQYFLSLLLISPNSFVCISFINSPNSMYLPPLLQLSTLFANTLYFIAFAYYYHITFLGYNGVFSSLSRCTSLISLIFLSLLKTHHCAFVLLYQWYSARAALYAESKGFIKCTIFSSLSSIAS